MSEKVIYRNRKRINRIYRDREKLYEGSPVTFYMIEDGKLIILGALSANSLPDGLYVDCAPSWVYPVQNGNVLMVEQVYNAVLNGNVLEVK